MEKEKLRAFQGNGLQAMMDGMGAQWQEERSKTQLTLGKLIDLLKEIDGERLIQGIIEPHSYRGYYIDLAFEPMEGKPNSVEGALGIAKSCMGEIFTGYKGGDFQMGRNTPLFIASYGNCGNRLMGLDTTDDVITLITAPEED